MKIEGETIVIRVGGVYLTIDDFVQLYCGGEDEQKNKITNLVYGGQCAGNKDFKTFYFTQTTVPDEQKRHHQSENFESQTQSIEVKTPGKRDSSKYKQKNVKLTLEEDADLPSPGKQTGK